MCVCNDAHPGFALFARVSAYGRKSSQQRAMWPRKGRARTMTTHGKSIRKTRADRRELACRGVRDEKTVKPKERHTQHARGEIRRAFGVTGGSIRRHTRRAKGEKSGR